MALGPPPGPRPCRSGAREPARKSGPDVDTHPGLLPPAVGEHAEQTVLLLDGPRRRLPGECAMDTLFARVAGLDVHLKSVSAAIRCRQEPGPLAKEVRSFG